MTGNKFAEIEYKYRADHLTMQEYLQFVANNFPVSGAFTVSGVDHYYASQTDSRKFLRYRTDDLGQSELTLKVKLSDCNTWHRHEVDVPLHHVEANNDIIRSFCEGLDFKPAFWIKKVNHVIHVKNPSLVFAYYTVNGEQSYLEIEAKKGAYDNLMSAQKAVNEAETQLEKIGILPEHRLTQSLYELYKTS